MTIKGFYDYCVEHKIDDYQLDCYGITLFGDVTHRAVLEPNMIHEDPEDKSIILWEDK
jgi:hypothetical protein